MEHIPIAFASLRIRTHLHRGPESDATEAMQEYKQLLQEAGTVGRL
jgi:hypothetical protein